MATSTRKAKPKQIENKFPNEGYATVIQAADFLAVSRWSVYRMVDDGRLPKAAFDNPVRIPWVDLQKLATVKIEDQKPARSQSKNQPKRRSR